VPAACGEICPAEVWWRRVPRVLRAACFEDVKASAFASQPVRIRRVSIRVAGSHCVLFQAQHRREKAMSWGPSSGSKAPTLGSATRGEINFGCFRRGSAMSNSIALAHICGND
jgi:hypothetical protein